MNKMKRLLSVVLALVLTMSLVLPAAAEGNAVAKIGDTEFATLQAAFDAAKDGDTIYVLQDIEFTTETVAYNDGTYIDGVRYTGDQSFTVDFGSHTITDDGCVNDYLIYMNNKGAKANVITLQNGTIASQNGCWATVCVNASSATQNSTVNLNNMTISNCYLQDDGNDVVRAREGATVNVNNGTTLTSNGAGAVIRANVTGVVNVNSGASVKQQKSENHSGSNYVGTAVTGTGTVNVYEGASITSDRYGFHTSTSGTPVFNVYGGTITAQTAFVASVDYPTAVATINVYGGTVTGTFQEIGNASSIWLYGGTFADLTNDTLSAYLPAGIAATLDGNGKLVPSADAVAVIAGGIGYTSLEAAISAAAPNDTITLMDDITTDQRFVLEQALTINGNNHTVSSSEKKTFEVFANATFKNIAIRNSYQIKNSEDTTGRCINTRVGNITLNLENVDLETTGSSNTQTLLIGGSGEKVTVNIKDSAVRATDSGYAFITFLPVELTVNNSELSGYTALYFKEGSAGSTVTAKNASKILSRNVHGTGTNDFGTIVLEDGNISVSAQGSTLGVTGKADTADKDYATNYLIMNRALVGNSVHADAACTVNVSDALLIYGYPANPTQMSVKLPAAVYDQLTEEGFVSVIESNVATIKYGPGHVHDSDRVIPAKAPTCTESGLTAGKACSTCGQVMEAQKIEPATDHDWGWRSQYIPNEGHKHIKFCRNICGTGDYKWEDHVYTHSDDLSKYIKWEETECGTVVYRLPECEVCGFDGPLAVAQKRVYNEAGAHVFDEGVVTKEAVSCTEPGEITYTCTVELCGFTKTEPITIPHTEVDVAAKAPTCTETGLTAGKKCSVCGVATVAQETVAALGHTEVDVAAKAATCTETGLTAGKKCSVCGVATVAQETVPALGHKLTKVDAVAATYFAAGAVEHYACGNCDALFADEKGETALTAAEIVIPQLVKVEEQTAEVSAEVVEDVVEEAVAAGTTDVVITVVEDKLAEDNKTEEDKTEDGTTKPSAPAPVVTKAKLPVAAVKKVAELHKEATLTVTMTSATVTLDKTTLDVITEKAKTEQTDAISLEVEHIDTKTLAPKQQKAVEDKKVAAVISASILVNDKEVHDFEGGEVKVSIPFTPAEGTKGSDYIVLYIADDGSVEEIPCTYVDGVMTMTLSHFSEYVIVDTTAKAVSTPTTGDSFNPALMIVLMVIAAAAVTVLVSKKRFAK